MLGFGTWVQYSAGRMLVGDGGPFSGTGGSANATLVSHNHTATNIITNASHTHTMSGTTSGQSVSHHHGPPFASNFLYGNVGSPSGGNYATGYVDGGGAFAPYIEAADSTSTQNTDHTHTFNETSAANGGDIAVATSIASSGSSATNANMPPYQVVYIWNRTA